MRSLRFHSYFSILFAPIFGAFILFSNPAHAIDPAPGAACALNQERKFSGGPELGGFGHWLVCVGGFWQASFTSDGSALMAVGTTSVGTGVRMEIAGGALRLSQQSSAFGGEIQFAELLAQGTNTVALRARGTLASSLTWLLPDTLGSAGNVMTVGAGGTLYWSAPAGGVTYPLLSTTLGSVGTPVFSFSSDSDTGMFSPGTGTLAFATNGTNRVNINSAGNVGIGTTNPAVALDVNGGGRFSNAGLLVGPGAQNYYLTVSVNDGVGAGFHPLMNTVRSTGNFAGLEFGYWSDGANDAAGYINSATTSKPLILATNNIERVRISGNGVVGIGTTAIGTGNQLEVTGGAIAAGNGGELRMMENLSQGTNFVALKARGTLASDLTWLLPDTIGAAGNVMTVGSGGTLYWSTPAGGVSYPLLSTTLGSVATPAYSFSTDTDTGIYSPGADSFAISTAGTTRFSVNGLGAVTFGSISSLQAESISTGTASIFAALFSHTANPSGITTGSYTGLHTAISRQAGNTNLNGATLTGVQAVTSSSGAGNTGEMAAFNSLNVTSGTGTIGNMFAFKDSDIATGPITNYYGVSIRPTLTAAVNTAYGLHVANMASSSAISYGMYVSDLSGTNTYGIYQVGRNDFNHLNGTLGIGTTAVSLGNMVEVTGAALAVGNGGELRMMESLAQGTNSVALRARGTLASNLTWLLPDSLGTAGNVMTVGSGGTLYWSAPSGSVTYPLLSTTLGSVGTPVFSFSADSDTGIFSPGANTLAISTGGVRRMTFDSNGNIGIGTGTPGAALSVVGGIEVLSNSGGGGQLYLSRNDSATQSNTIIFSSQDSTATWELGVGANDGDVMKLYSYNGGGIVQSWNLSDGYTGINTDMPASQFSVRGNVSIGTYGSTAAAPTNGMVVSGNVGIGTSAIGAGNKLEVTGGAIAAGNGGELRMMENLSQGTNSVALKARGTLATNLTWLLPDSLGTSGQVMTVGTGGTLYWAAPSATVTYPLLSTTRGSVATPAYSFSGDPDTGIFSPGTGTLAFSTNGNLKLTLDDNGIAIGSAIPSAALDVKSDGGVAAGFNGGSAATFIAGRAAGNFAGVSMGYWADGANDIDGAIVTASDPTGLVFATRPAGTAVIQMKIAQNGAIGMGTTTVSAGTKLEVTGGAITAGNGGEFRMMENLAQGTNSVALRARGTLASNLTWLLPDSLGSAGNLMTVGSGGTLYWSAPSATVTYPLLSTTLGSVGTPVFSFSADSDTGMYSPGTGTLAFATNGTNRINITSNGYVGIGTANPDVDLHIERNLQGRVGALIRNTSSNNGASAMLTFANDLSITGTDLFMNSSGNSSSMGGNNSFVINNLINGGSIVFGTNNFERARIDTNGLVGIGTTAVRAGNQLEVTGGAIAAGNGGQLRMMENLSQGTNFVAFRARGTLASDLTWLLPDSLGTAGNVMTVGTGGTLYWANPSATVTYPLLSTTLGSVGTPVFSFSADSDTGIFSPGTGTLAFATNGTNRINIDPSGNVGVGTSAPAAKLHVFSSGGTVPTMTVDNDLIVQNNSAAGSEAGITIIGGATGFSTLALGDSASQYKGWISSENATTALRFGTGGGERMRLDSAGNLAIGTIAASARLDVFGGVIKASQQSTTLGGEVQFAELLSQGTNTVALRARGTLASSLTWLLPDTLGTAGNVMTVGSGGTLYWSAAGGGSQWTTQATGIYYSSGSVSIGGTSAISRLDVRDTRAISQGDALAGYIRADTSTGNVQNATALRISANSPSNSTVTGIDFETMTGGNATPIKVNNVTGATSTPVIGLSFGTLSANNGDLTVVDIKGVSSTSASNVYLVKAPNMAAGSELIGIKTGTLTPGASNIGAMTYTSGITTNNAGAYGSYVGAINTSSAGVARGLYVGSLTATSSEAHLIESGAISSGLSTEAGAVRTGNISSAGNGQAYAIKVGAINANSSASSAFGFYATSLNSSDSSAGLQIPTITSTNVNGSAYGVKIDSITSVASNGNTYGVYLGSMSSGAGRTPFPFYSTASNGLSYFAGTVSVGNTSVANGVKLQVEGGAIRAAPKGTGVGAAGEIQFSELAANGTNWVSLRAPDNIGQNLSITLPGTLGAAGEVMTIGTGGTLYWATPSASASAAGGTTQVQFNSSGTLGASPNFLWSEANTRLHIGSGGTPQGALSIAHGSSGNPATSGTTDPNIALRAQRLDLGQIASGDVWFQPRNPSNLATNHNLLLVPNGGSVGIGTLTPVGIFDIRKDQDGVTSARVFNSTGGAAGAAEWKATASTTDFSFTALHPSYSSFGANQASAGVITSSGAGGMSLVNTSSADFRVYTGGFASGNERFRISSAGSVGIGTPTPDSQLQVAGTFRASSISSTSGTAAVGSVNFANGNAITSATDCTGAADQVKLANIRDGGSYTLVVTGTGTALCDFDEVVTGQDATTVTYRFNPANAVRTASSHTVYTMIRVGNIIYVSWITGF